MLWPHPPTRLVTPIRRFAFAVLGLLSVTTAGTAGYMVIEDASLLDALYMTIITVTTVGYGEVFPLSRGGRIFTMLLLVMGVGATLYLLTVLAELVIEGRLREFWNRTAMQNRIDQLSDHVIICGYGRFGYAVVGELVEQKVKVVVIDSDPTKEALLVQKNLPYMIASALSDETLESAGIGRARAVVVGTPSDPDNVFITLSAREKNPSIAIHARCESEPGLRRLRLAGATQVVSAYHMGGMRIAASILRPSVVDFLDISAPGRGEEIDLEQIKVPALSALSGRDIREIETLHARLRVVALKRGEEPIRLIPEATTKVTPGDHLVVIGDRGALRELADFTERK